LQQKRQRQNKCPKSQVQENNLIFWECGLHGLFFTNLIKSQHL
jgi:hypothetical protein